LDLTVEESTFNNFVQEWSGGLGLSLTQPLLRGRGKSANLARVRRAQNSRLSGEHQLEQQFMNSLAEVVKAYWDLVGAHEELRVREESLANAERLLHINERRLEIGHGAALDVVQSKAGVAARLSDFVAARSQIGDAEDRLKQLLDMRDEDVLVPAKIIPVDRPEPGEIELDEATCVQHALQSRPEIAMAEIDIDSAEIERKRAANDMLPQLDLSGSYHRGGRGPDARDVFRGIEFESDSVWSAALEGSIPITNRVGRGLYHGALVSKRQALQRLQQRKVEVATNVRMAMRGVETSRTLVESNRQTVALQQTNVEAETKRLQLGVTTSYDVLKIQEDLTTAQSQEVQAQVGFEKAIVDLQLAEGSILNAYGVDFEPPEPERPVKFLRSIVPPGVRDN
jgi:outer membrane protein TolC